VSGQRVITLDTKERSSSTGATAHKSADELLCVRNEAAHQLRQVTTQLEAVELEREHMTAEIALLRKSESERGRLRRWIEDIDQELCAAQGRIRELESRIEALSGLNARLSLERAELRARLDTLSDADFALVGDARSAVTMQRRLSELEAELARLIARDALHQESTEEVRSLRAQLETARSGQEELQNELARMHEALSLSQDATADKATELDLLRDFVDRDRQNDAGARAVADGCQRTAADFDAEIRRLKEELKLTRLSAAEERAGLHEDLRQVERAACEAAAARDRQAATVDRLLAERGAAQREAAAVREELRAIEWARAEIQVRANRLEEELSASRRVEAELTGALEAERERAGVAESVRSDLETALAEQKHKHAAEVERLGEQVRQLQARLENEGPKNADFAPDRRL
jgi:chromosome segregation ATPase